MGHPFFMPALSSEWGQSTRIHIFLALLTFRIQPFRMDRQPRFQYPGALYHVMARGNGGDVVFVTDSGRFVKVMAGRSTRGC